MAMGLSLSVFAVCLVATFGAALLGRIHSKRLGSSGLQDQKLNKWYVGLSAGATANSGFVVTGAVGLGFSYGVQWLLLPVAWLMGDIIFWLLFPQRINRVGADTKATTIADLLSHELSEPSRRLIKITSSLIILCCLGGYVAAQWLAGQKFLTGAFALDGRFALSLFALSIIAYTALGGFRGSVYADSLQAIIRLGGTVIALIAIIWICSLDQAQFRHNLAAAGPGFLDPWPQSSLVGTLGFFLGFGAAALGFSLGQPQMVSRYVAGANPRETQSAWWIYLGFVHFTWLSMTLFGVLLRGLMPQLADPEAGLSAFFHTYTGPILTGLIAADIFATISATANSLLVAMSQTVNYDLRSSDHSGTSKSRLWAVTLGLGVITIGISQFLHSSVFNLALSAASFLGAALAPSMAVTLFDKRPSGRALFLSIVAGLAVAAIWRVTGYAANLNEAFPGMLAGLIPLLPSVFSTKRTPDRLEGT